MSKIKYYCSAPNRSLIMKCKAALNWIEYKRSKEVVYPPIIKEIDALGWWARSNYVGLYDGCKWKTYAYAKKFAIVNAEIHTDDLYSKLSYRWWLMVFGSEHKRDIEQLLIILSDDSLVDANGRAKEYIEVDGDILDNLLVWEDCWKELVKCSMINSAQDDSTINVGSI